MLQRLRLNETKLNVGQNERWLSLAVGALLAFYGLRRSWGGLLMALAGGYLTYRGISGNCKVYQALNLDTREKIDGAGPVTSLPEGIEIRRSVTVNRSPGEVYLFWRNLENLPRFMDYLQSVTMTGSKTSHWVAKAPLGGLPIAWDAEITEERRNELIAWGALPGSTVMNTGEVRFVPAPGGRGTEVQVTLTYALPGGPAGAAVGKLLNKITAQTVKENLRHFKEVMETGEVPTTQGQPSGRSAFGPPAGRQPSSAETRGRVYQPAPAMGARQRDVVHTASEDSFPASDPPAYNMGMD